MLIYRCLCFAIGLILSTTGMIFVTIYLALLNYGFTFGEFIVYLFSNKSFYLLPVGILLMCFSLFFNKMWNRFSLIKEGRRHRERVLK